MSKTVDSLIVKVVQIVTPILADLDIDLVDAEYLSEQGRWVLRIYIDKAGGVILDDCARVSGEIGDLLDVKDLFHDQYVLEVSSPGLNRSLKRDVDFFRCIGKKIKVKMSSDVDCRKNFTGYIRGFNDGILKIEIESDMVFLALRDVVKANLVYEFKS